MPPKRKVKSNEGRSGANPKGGGRPKTTPMTIRGKPFCRCTNPISGALSGLHNPGKHEPTEPTHDNAFLSFLVPELAQHVAQNNWTITSARANLYELKDKRASIQSRDNAVQAAKEAAQKKKLEEDAKVVEKKRQKEEEQCKKEIDATRASFLSFKYGKSVEERQAIGPWPEHCLVANEARLLARQAAAAEQFTSLLDTSLATVNEQALSQQLHRGASSAGRHFNQAAFHHPSLEGPDRLFRLPGLTDQAFTAGPESLPTPADSRRQSLRSAGRSDQYPTPPSDIDMSVQPPAQDPTSGVNDAIKNVIQELFATQQHISQFRIENQDRLNRQFEEVAQSVVNLEQVNSRPDNPLHDIKVAPEIIDYVDDGRNPDIFTREFVELVQRGNSVMAGKQKAFKDFSKVFATKLKEKFDGMDAEVDLIMGDAGMEQKDGKWVDKQETRNGAVF